ncbi:MAG: WbqC family protein [Patescibacteria group bacterium]
MRGAILQPSYLPWLGFFEQFIFSEHFIFLDDVDYTKKDWRNRNRVRINSKQGWSWLTVPIKKQTQDLNINEAEIDYSRNWIDKHLSTIKNIYKKTKYFDTLFPIIENHLKKKYILLVDLNINLFLDIADFIDIKRKNIRSSTLKITEKDKNLRLISICKKTGIDYLYDGEKATDFIDIDLFLQNGIKVEFQKYNHPEYTQRFKPFIPYLSAIDLLFNYGKDSLDYIIQNTKIKAFV